MQRLKELVPQLAAEGRRMLIFSQWTRLLDILEILMEDLGMDFLRLDGQTPVKERQDLINRFSAPDSTIPVFLLSTKAGGLGINLTAADTVILHDLDFNPENDRQAEDRCHRIGQTKHVRVYKLVASDSVDEDIYEIGERKKRLTTAVLENVSSQGAGAGGRKKGKAADAADADEGDIGEIGRILQKALQKSVASMVAEKKIETVASKLTATAAKTATASASGSNDISSSAAADASSKRIGKKIIVDDDDEELVMC
jgi:superfamily II DNA/RNA helicase